MKNIKKLALFSLFLILSSNQPIETETSALKTVAGCSAAGLSVVMGIVAFLNEFVERDPSMDKKRLKKLNAKQLKVLITTLGFVGMAAYLYNTGGNKGAIATAAITPGAIFTSAVLLLLYGFAADRRAGRSFNFYGG